ncbi:flagellar biosynthesis anti-sigma factor FlgM [Paenibacillus mucilaginosus]|uniref:Negative regulator of flagellin synthesis n=2 Tax=Paenibacillus mucilaginosus TaxID=61624 RepID=H6NT69_9BACL|nr:flagellar biosynthesis anti-sigma factor FlgM [Paenibacillus mucilaginosus]AEI38750.1 anti-sigma-28 factor FlgM family protein [Paenibacillus mucilaginosus KNP414]AFC27082.1 anti-sigma-28 factor FlgM family protein [Paenibacillus mucilaginosus 3016]MCG7215884.1 flagellar biosynthesis anti-sigma factor FlgM [Paenibacillus mucilaginosus]WDM27832.1 flagellar biosynthesis anti-sigma factor FlgM [Paenibacillus mucilaginosus]WFA16016.1 flagellar biosynthesis anti-sigma factor FlgM [Paenibacillus 
MKINGSNQMNAISRYKKTAEPQQAAAPAKAKPKDQVEISSQAKELLESQSVKSAGAAADARAEKIQSLKQAVQSGTYSVDAGKLAERLLPYLT